MSNVVALLAGEGDMPRMVAEEIYSSEDTLFLIAIKGITSPAIEQYADDILWVSVTQIGRVLRECVKRRITRVVMAGRVHHKEIFSLSLLRMDWTTLRLWWKLPDKRADTILGAIADVFQQRGIIVADTDHYLKRHMAKEGVLTIKKPSSDVMKDVSFGSAIAKKMGGLDIGQTVVVKKRSVVAVEAMEGTDQCIERAGAVAGEGCVVVKMAKPDQDMRFDVPTIGVNTIEKLAKIGASALAIEAEKTLIIDEETVGLADSLGIVIVSLCIRS